MLFNERKEIGGTFVDPARARMWDERSAKLEGRFSERARDIADMLRLRRESTLVDLGCGTGQYTLELAEHCAAVYAVDVSSIMLNLLRKKALSRSQHSIVPVNKGMLEFLSQPDTGPVDAFVSQTALHHLPDFWKSVALHGMARILKPDGRIFIADVIYSFPVADYERHFDAMVREIDARGDDGLTEDTRLHLREEFSTFAWIMEGMFADAGLEIEKRIVISPTYSAYVLMKAGQ